MKLCTNSLLLFFYKILKSITLFLFLLCANILFAQQPVTVQLTEKDGLPDIEFYDILEDKEGFIWLAADKGLFRYDGRNFVNFSHPLKRGLSVFGLCTDTQGRIWCNNISGQFFFVTKNKLNLFTDLKSDLKGRLPEFFVTNTKLIALAEKGVFTIDLKSKSKNITSDSNSTSPFYNAPFLYQNQLFFLLNNCVKSKIGNKIQTVFEANSKTDPGRSNFFAFDNKLFLTNLTNGTNAFFVKQNKAGFSKMATPKALEKSIIIKILCKDNLVWFCTNQGVVVCSWNGIHFEFQNTYLQDEFITNALKDKDGNYWFSTLRNGVFIMPNIFVAKINLPKKDQNIATLCNIENQYVVYGTPNSEIGYFKTSNPKVTQFSLPKTSKVADLFYNSHYKSLLINQESGCAIWDLNAAQFVKTNHLTISKGMSDLGNNRILNASFDRVSIIENPFQNSKKSETLKELKIPNFSSNSTFTTASTIRNKRAYSCFYSFQDQKKYVGFIDDFLEIDKNGKTRIIRYNNQPIFAINIQQTQNGILWVSTFKDGVLGIKNGRVVKKYTTQNGLLSNQTDQLKADRNDLWIVTSEGVQKVATQSNTWQNLTKTDGLETYNISDIELLNSKVYLASNKGIFAIDKNKCFKVRKPLNVYFSGVEIQEKDTLIASQYQLEHDKNAIKFTFNTNGYNTKESVAYSYRMLGLNSGWIQLERGVNFVRYTSLPPGNFIFEVKATQTNGSFSKTMQIKLDVNAPFWQKWWFYVVLSVSVIGLSWVFFKTRIKRIEKEKQIELEKAETDKELIYSQLENLRSQMNPHFIFNALNSIQEYIVTNDKQTASVFLVKFSRLIRIYLEHSRESEVPLNEEIKALQLYLDLEKDRFEDTLDFEINVNTKINTFDSFVPSLFIQPYVENALKHGLLHKKSNRKLLVNFELNSHNQCLICTITDNGIGRKASGILNEQNRKGHRSFATSANQKRIELINKTRIHKTSVEIKDIVENDTVQGTIVIITIPQRDKAQLR